MPQEMAVVSTLSDDEIDRRLQELVRGERRVLVVFLAHLAEFDRRRAHEPASFSSLFVYCTKRLGLSESEAYLRIRAARVTRDHPEAMHMLASGEIHLSAIARLSAHLTMANAVGLLTQARGMTRREVEHLALTFESRPIKADVVRALPAPPPRLESPLKMTTEHLRPDLAAVENHTTEPPPLRHCAEKEVDERRRMVRISFTATERLVSRIERARALLRHKHPDGRLEFVIADAIESLLDACDPERRLQRRKAPRPPKPGHAGSEDHATSRAIPQWIRDAVWRRDDGRCSFVSKDGRRCEATDWLEYDHIHPWALGGRSDTPENIRLLCRTHNQMTARNIFGPRQSGAG